MAAEERIGRQAQLIAAVEFTRSAAAKAVGQLGEELNFPARIRRSFREHPLPWVTGLVAAGLLLGVSRRLLRGKEKPGPARVAVLAPRWMPPWSLAVLQFAMPLLKPAILVVAQRLAYRMAARR